MRTFLCLLALSLAAVGCGAGAETGGGGAPTASTATEQADTSRVTEDLQTPPPIVLASDAGRQTAVPGSFCVDYTDEAAGQAVGACGDSGPITPERLSTVRRGEEVRIVLEHANVTRPEGCVSEEKQSCIGSVAVHPLGCERKIVAEIPLALGPETNWRVDLEPGAYELDVFAYFDAPDGRTGDVSGSLGVLVDQTAPLEIAPAGKSPDCPGR